MRTSILSIVFTGVLGVVALGCGDSAHEDGSLSESALKGTLPDGGSCRCVKTKKDKGDAGRGKSDEDHGKSDAGRGKSDEDHGKADAGRGKSDEDHGKADAGRGKSDEEHGNQGADEDEMSEEDSLEDEDLETLKFTPDGGAKGKKPAKEELPDCLC